MCGSRDYTKISVSFSLFLLLTSNCCKHKGLKHSTGSGCREEADWQQRLRKNKKRKLHFHKV